MSEIDALAEKVREALERLPLRIYPRDRPHPSGRFQVHSGEEALTALTELADRAKAAETAEAESAHLRETLIRVKRREWVDGPCWCTNAPPSDQDYAHGHGCMQARIALAATKEPADAARPDSEEASNGVSV